MAVASSNKFPKVTLNVSTGVAAASTGTYNSWMSTAGKLTVTSSSGGETIIGPSTSTITVPADSSVGVLYTRPTSAHTDDDEFAGTGLGGWTELDVSGTTTWTEDGHAANVVFDDQSSGDVCALVKAITSASAPMTIETAVSAALHDTASLMLGIFFADGATAGDNVVAVLWWTGTGVNNFALDDGTFTSGLGSAVKFTSPGHESSVLAQGTPFRVRLIWSAANTWKFQVSPTGLSGSWTDWGSTSYTVTMTPTHFGLIVSTFAGGSPGSASFEYFRVYNSDTSA